MWKVFAISLAKWLLLRTYAIKTNKNKLRYGRISSDVIIYVHCWNYADIMWCFFALVKNIAVSLKFYSKIIGLDLRCQQHAKYPSQSSWTKRLIWFDIFFSSLIAWRTREKIDAMVLLKVFHPSSIDSKIFFSFIYA